MLLVKSGYAALKDIRESEKSLGKKLLLLWLPLRRIKKILLTYADKIKNNFITSNNKLFLRTLNMLPLHFSPHKNSNHQSVSLLLSYLIKVERV